MTTIDLFINPNPNFDVAPTDAELCAVRDEAVRRVREYFPEAEVNGDVRDNLRSYSYWSEEGDRPSADDEQRITWAINEAWDHVFQC